MAGKTAILSVRIISDSDRGVNGLQRTARAVGVLEKSAKRGGASLRGMAAATPRILALGTAIISLGSALIVSVGHLSAFMAALAPLGGLFLGLPGIIAGAGLAIGVLVMAMKDAGKHLGDLGPKFGAIQKHVSAEFWQRAAAPIRSLALSVLPTLDRALTNSGRILGTAFASSADAAKSTLAKVLAPALSNINVGFANAAKGAAPFTRAILNLTAAGTTILPRLGTAIANVAARFDRWVSGAAADGRLTKWINDGVTAFRDLGSLLGGLGRIMGKLFVGLSTGGTLGTMAKNLHAVADAMGSVKGQAAMATVMRGAQNVMAAWGTVIRGALPGIASLGNSLRSLGPVLTAVSKQAGPVLTPVLKALGGVIAALAPHMTKLVNVVGPALASAFSVLGPVLGKIAAQLGPIIVQLGTGLASVVTALAPKLAGVGTAFAGLLAAIRPLLAIVLPVLVPALKILGTIFLTAVKGAIEGVTQVIRGVTQILSGLVTFIKGVFTGNWKMAWEGLKTVAAGVFNAIVGAIKTWLNVTIVGIFRGGLLKLATMWKGGLTPLKNIAANVWAGIRGFFSRGINGAKSVVTGGLSGIRNYFSAQLNRLRFIAGAVWSAIRLVFSRNIAAARAVVTTGVRLIRTVFSAQIGALRAIASRVWAAVRGFFSRGIAGARAVVSAGARLIRTVFSAQIGALRGIASRVWAAVRGLFSRGTAAARAVVTSGMSAVRAVFTRAMSAVRGAASAAWSAIRGVFSRGVSSVRGSASNGMSAVRGIFTRAMSAIRTATSNGIGRVVSIVRDLPGRIKRAVGGLVSNFEGMGRDMMRGLANGISGAGGRVSDMVIKTVKKSVDWAKKWLGIASPSKVFADIGRDTGRGFVVGLEGMHRKTAVAMAGLVEPPKVPELAPRSSSTARASARYGGTVVNVTVNGAVDPMSTARQIKDILRAHDVVTGSAA